MEVVMQPASYRSSFKLLVFWVRQGNSITEEWRQFYGMSILVLAVA